MTDPAGMILIPLSILELGVGRKLTRAEWRDIFLPHGQGAPPVPHLPPANEQTYGRRNR